MSSGDLVMTTTSSDNMGLYECVAVFSSTGYRNVTLARYTVAYSEPLSAGILLMYNYIILARRKILLISLYLLSLVKFPICEVFVFCSLSYNDFNNRDMVTIGEN